MVQKRFLSIRETAKTGVISEHHLRQMVAQGQAPGFYVGSHFRVNVPMLMDETLHFYSKYYIDELLDCYEKSYPIDNLCVNQLEKLSGPDRGGSSDLELLYLYLCSERNISLTGKKMNMHRNSVIYRLQRINDSLNLDLGDPDVRFRLMLAFKVLSRKNILNISNRDNTEPSSIVHIE